MATRTTQTHYPAVIGNLRRDAFWRSQGKFWRFKALEAWCCLWVRNLCPAYPDIILTRFGVVLEVESITGYDGGLAFWERNILPVTLCSGSDTSIDSLAYLLSLYLVGTAIFGSGVLWTSIWQGFLYAALGFPVGWVAGLIAGGVIGFGVGLVIWMARQLDKKPGK